MFRLVFEHAADGILIADPNGRYTHANPRACEMLGYSCEELLHKHVVDLTATKDWPRLEQARAYLLQNSTHARSEEWELLRKDGSAVPVEMNARILEDGCWLAIVRDISERRRAERELARNEEEIRDLYDNAPCGYHSTGRDGVYLRVNQTELDWTGYAREELVGRRTFAEMLSAPTRPAYEEYAAGILVQESSGEVEVELVRKDGGVLPVLLRASVLKDGSNTVLIRTMLFDMSDLADARNRLHQAATVFEHTNDAIIVTDANRKIIAVNPAFTRITGYEVKESIGQTPALLKSGRHIQEFYQHLWNTLDTHGTWQGEIWDCRKSGELFPAWESINAVKDSHGRVTNYISVFSDITSIKATEQKLSRLAYQDTLTGLANRLLFNDRMEHVLAHARRHKKRVTLLLLDLDRFKLINDSLGHAAGDRLLQIVAQRLKESVREEDTVARLGGDEFAIIFTSLDSAEDAVLLAQKLTTAVTRTVCIAEHSFSISTSIGISVFPDDASDGDGLYKSADMALYGAKAKGRNGYEFYTPEMTCAANETLLMGRELRQAVQQDELVLTYQPMISLTSGCLLGVEALLRWKSPVRGVQLPSGFVKFAEDADLIEVIDDRVIDMALARIEHWRRIDAAPIRIAVNLSSRQLKRPGFLSDLRHKLTCCDQKDKFGLEIEVKENLAEAEKTTMEALRELKSFGLTVAIDNFGMGSSCLNSLKRLPVDVLKIDRSIIGGLPEDADDKAVTASIIAMAHQMGLSVAAAGVESQEQLGFLVEHRCDRAQGFLFSMPLADEQCDALLLAGTTRIFSTLRVGMQSSS